MLPKLFKEITDLTSLKVALELCAAVGGTRVYIPQTRTLTPDHWLAGAVGIDAAKKICEHYGGGHLEIPLAGQGVAGRVHRILVRGIERGASENTLARRAGVHRRTVRRWRRKLTNTTYPSNQYNLFGADTCPPYNKS